MLKMRRLASTPCTIGIVARMMGTAPRSPAQDQDLLLPRHPEGRQAQHHAQRARHHGQHQADEEGGHDVVAEFVRGDQQAEQDEHADLSDPAEPVGEAAGGGPMRQFRVAQHHRGEVDAEEAAAVRQRAARVRRDGDRHDGDGVEAGGGQRHVPEPPGAEPAHREPDGGTDGQLQRYLAHQYVPVVDRARRGEGHDQDDDRGVVEAGLRLQNARHARGEGDFAQHREDGGRVRGGDDRPDDECLPPFQPDQIVRARRGDPDAYRDAGQCQRGGGGQRRFDVLPLRAQSALGEDHDEGRVSDDLGEFGVVEADVADAVLAHGDADAQVHEQAGEPAARGDPDRCHGDEQDERADEQ
jgi:hypothetical protein